MPAILVLCTANMVRSPIAEALLLQKLKLRDDATEWRVESAGTWALPGKPAASMTLDVMRRKYGINLITHRTRVVSRELLSNFDLVLVMEKGHKEAIRLEFPEFTSRVYLLYEMVGQVRNVEDPIGGSMADFEDTAHEIDGLLSRGLEKIIQIARGEHAEEVD